MSFSEGSDGSSSPESVALGQALSFFGNVADHAAGGAPQDGERVAALAVAMARLAGLASQDCDALYFAAQLRNAGALGNAAFAKGEPQNERTAAIARWDIPAHGARVCERIAALPDATADIVRWQSECWDGTGFPDQLRWSGIPKPAQLLHLAASFVAFAEPEEALAGISAGSGRTFAPEQVRAFVMWFHTFGGTIEPIDVPHAALNAGRSTPDEIVTILSQLIDEHNGTPERAQRVAARANDIGCALALSAETLRSLQLASAVYGLGELRSPRSESAAFDALGRLGIQTRADNAVRAAESIARCPFLQGAAPIVRARAEWYDGTGAPDGLRHDAIPPAAHVLALAIAYEALDEAYRTRVAEHRILPIVRLETAAGTQFDPKAVRALAEVLKART